MIQAAGNTHLIRQGAVPTRLPTVRGVSSVIEAVRATAGQEASCRTLHHLHMARAGEATEGRDKGGHIESTWQGMKCSFQKAARDRKD